MHPEVVSDKPGLCPECGMALLPTQIHADKEAQMSADEGIGVHPRSQQRTSASLDKHAGHSVNIFKRKFWVSLVLTVPIVLYSEVAQKIGIALPELAVGSWKLEVLTPALLGSAVFFYGGFVFLIGAYRELRARLPGMMTLIALAITAAYLFSIFVVLFGGTKTLFWELSTLVVIMLLGHWVEMRAVSGAQGALRELSKLLPDFAERIARKTQGTEAQNPNKTQTLQNTNAGFATERIALEELRVGDWVLVKPGAKVPADGMIIEGQSELNESLLTGESKPVFKKEKDSVIAGAVNGDGSLVVEIKEIGEHTFLAGIKKLVAEAQASKSRLQMLADKAALLLTVIAIVAGGGTLSAWLFAGAGIVFAMERLVAVLVVACPHALGLAIPLVASISTTKAARNGVLVKQRLALEAARNIDTVLFDKTGTLTKGEYGVTDILPLGGSAEDVISRAASVEYFSEHPIAHAIVNEAKKRKLRPIPAGKFERIPGKGAKAVIDETVVKVGSYELLKDDGVSIPAPTKERAMALAKEGKTIIFVLSGRTLIGALALADMIRPESKDAVAALKEMGLKIAMITGDSEEVGKWVARELGLDDYFARVLPGEKAEIVRRLQRGATNLKQSREADITESQKELEIGGDSMETDGDKWRGKRTVAFVGDGVNDAPALTQADLGIAIGAGTNVAIESAGIILVKSDPRDIVKIIRLSRLTYRKMIQNLWWAAGYNIIAIPLAAGALAYKGILLEPAVAAILMSVSTVIVAFNAVLLKRQKI
jgi:Cu2+-exporting ATPase